MLTWNDVTWCYATLRCKRWYDVRCCEVVWRCVMSPDRVIRHLMSSDVDLVTWRQLKSCSLDRMSQPTLTSTPTVNWQFTISTNWHFVFQTGISQFQPNRYFILWTGISLFPPPAFHFVNWRFTISINRHFILWTGISQFPPTGISFCKLAFHNFSPTTIPFFPNRIVQTGSQPIQDRGSRLLQVHFTICLFCWLFSPSPLPTKAPPTSSNGQLS